MRCEQSIVEGEGTSSRGGEMEENPVSQSSDASGSHTAPSPPGLSQPQKQPLNLSWILRTTPEASLFPPAISQTS